MQTEYIGPPGPTAEEYRMNNMIANGWGSEPHTDSSDTKDMVTFSADNCPYLASVASTTFYCVKFAVYTWLFR